MMSDENAAINPADSVLCAKDLKELKEKQGNGTVGQC